MKAILTYHSIDDSGSPVSLDKQTFRAHVDWLASGQVKVVRLRDLLAFPAVGDAVAITFDDGLENFGTIAAPLLQEAGLPVTLFVVSDRAGGENDWDRTRAEVPRMNLLGWNALREMVDQGIDLGAHTRTHPGLTQLDRPSLEDEILGGADRIEEETGQAPAAFAYPYGIHDKASRGIVARRFEIAVTADLDVVRPSADPHRLPRLDMWYYRDPARLRAWGTHRFGLHLGARRLARGIRKALARRG